MERHECDSSSLFFMRFRGSSALHLAVLHPRKLVVYNVVGGCGLFARVWLLCLSLWVCVAVSGTELASHCTLTQMYQHNLERTSCNMTLGSFGGVSGELVTVMVLRE